MSESPPGVAWLADLPMLSPAQRREVVSVFRRGLLESPLPSAIADLDDGRLLGCNAQFEAMLGIEETALLGQRIGGLVHPDDLDKLRAAFERLRSGESRLEQYEARWVRPDGRVVWTRRHVMRVDGPSSDSRTYVVAVMEDLTAAKLNEQLASALVAIGAGIAAGASLEETVRRLSTLAQARWSEVGCVLTMIDAERNVLIPVCPNALANGWLDELTEIPIGPGGGANGGAAWRDEPTSVTHHLDHDAPLTRTFATHRIVSSWAVPLHDLHGEVIGTLGVFHPYLHDPTESDWGALTSVAGVAAIAIIADARRRSASYERQRVRTDPRTGLLNGVAFLEQLDAMLAQSEPVTVAVATLRGPGRLASQDAVAKLALTTLATRASSLGQVPHVAATGVTSLAIAANAEWGEREARLLHRVLTRPLEIGTSLIRPEVAVGVCVAAADEVLTAAELLAQATLAVPARGGAHVVEPQLVEDSRDHQLAADVARGMRDGEFVVYYQPQFDLVTGAATGSEALVRWNHPERGVLVPAEFLPVIECTGASTELAFFMVRAIAAERTRRSDLGLHGRVAVNITVEDLLNESFLQVLRDPEDRLWTQLSLELTETQFARAEAVTALEELAALGYVIALDDFGTGYSALSSLHTLPVSIVKVDRSFVERLPYDASAEALIAAITALCQQLAITVVAEGVETEAQARAVRDLGCRIGQGYLFGRPQPLGALAPDNLKARSIAPRSRRSAAPRPIGAAAIARLMELHQTGASAATIAAALNRSGYRAAGGTRWHARSVLKALTDGDV